MDVTWIVAPVIALLGVVFSAFWTSGVSSRARMRKSVLQEMALSKDLSGEARSTARLETYIDARIHMYLELSERPPLRFQWNRSLTAFLPAVLALGTLLADVFASIPDIVSLFCILAVAISFIWYGLLYRKSHEKERYAELSSALDDLRIHGAESGSYW